MKESTCIRLLLVGLALIVLAFLIPSRAAEWARAIPAMVGSVLVLLAAFGLLRLPQAGR